MTTEFCFACGHARGDKIGCCGEADHWMSAREFKEYHGDWPEDADEDDMADPHAGPDYRLPEQYYADQAHEKRRKHMLGED